MPECERQMKTNMPENILDFLCQSFSISLYVHAYPTLLNLIDVMQAEEFKGSILLMDP